MGDIPHGAPSAMKEALLSIPSFLFLGAFVFIPIAFVIFGTVQTGSPLEPGAFTLENLRRAYTTSASLTTFLNTLMLSFSVSTISVLTGVFFAWVVTRTDTPHRTFLSSLLLLPMIISPFTALIAWIALLSPKSGLLNYVLMSAGAGVPLNIFSFYGMVLVLFLYYVPYAYLLTSSPLNPWTHHLKRLHMWLVQASSELC